MSLEALWIKNQSSVFSTQFKCTGNPGGSGGRQSNGSNSSTAYTQALHWDGVSESIGSILKYTCLDLFPGHFDMTGWQERLGDFAKLRK